MSDATDQLARSRQAILQQIHRRERRHDPHETGPGADYGAEHAMAPPRGAGWLAKAKYMLGTWWRYHPAHMAVDVATPILRGYARHKPVQVLGFSALAGFALVFAKPWRLLSLTTILVAVLKSSHLPGLLMSALSAADFERDQERPP